MEDTAIVALYWAREERALEETERKYGSYCRTIAHNILKNREDTEECVNDTYMRAWHAMPPQILTRNKRYGPTMDRITGRDKIAHFEITLRMEQKIVPSFLFDKL